MLKASQKLTQFKAFTAFTLCSVGIPIIYYGSEQAFGGGNDPYNREIMWNNFDENHEMYKFI
jgi:alpha-amylase